MEAAHQFHAGAAGGLDHRFAFGGVHGERLFAQDVLARFERGDCRFGVQEVGRRDRNRVDVVALEHFAEIGVSVFDAELLQRRPRARASTGSETATTFALASF